MGIFLKFFLNPKFLIVLAILVAVGGVYWKFNSMQNDLIESAAALKLEQDNNVVLRGSLETLNQVNQANEKVLKQQSVAAKTNVETIQKLATDLKKSHKSFGDIKGKIDAIKVDPVPLTPYFKEAIDGIQTQRNLLNPPPIKEPTK